MAQLFVQIGLGSLMMAVAIAVQAVTIALAFRVHVHFSRTLSHPSTAPFVLLVSAAALWMLAGQTIGVWLWALALIKVGAFPGLEPALYYALAAYTTLGFGDLIPPDDWRIFGAMIGANGMLAFGLAAAALVELVRRIRHNLEL